MNQHKFSDVEVSVNGEVLKPFDEGEATVPPEQRPELKLVGIDVIQADLFARAVRAAAKAKTPAAAKAALEKLGAVFTDGLNFQLAGLEAKLAPLDPGVKARENDKKIRRAAAKRARKARREARRA